MISVRVQTEVEFTYITVGQHDKTSEETPTLRPTLPQTSPQCITLILSFGTYGDRSLYEVTLAGGPPHSLAGHEFYTDPSSVIDPLSR